jgi:prevent-host-death family protein
MATDTEVPAFLRRSVTDGEAKGEVKARANPSARGVYADACTLLPMADSVSVREARAGLASIIDRALDGGATVITRDGVPVAAVVSMDDFNALEDAIDEYFARRAEAVAADEEGQRRYSMSEIVADIFDEREGAA